MGKVVETYTPEEAPTEEEKFKAMLFLLRADEYRHGQIFEYLKKSYFLGRDEYSESIWII